jgi:hypothetical protein
MKKQKKKFRLLIMDVEQFLHKNGTTCHGAFLEQCPKSNIIFLETSNGAKRIELHKNANTKPSIMKRL